MILKKQAIDFIVTENLTQKYMSLISKTKGSYKIFLLDKIELDTIYCLRQISKENDIPLDKINFCGLKDRHAKTFQYITIPSMYKIDVKRYKLFNIKHIGYTEEKLRLGLNKSNSFEITVRKLTDIEESDLNRNIKHIPSPRNIYIPNYFDDQRFSNTGLKKELHFDYIFRWDLNGFVRFHLTNIINKDEKELRQKKRELEEIFESKKSKFFSYENVKGSLNLQKIYDFYNRKKDFFFILKTINNEDIDMWYSAFLSFYFNFALANYIEKNYSKIKISDYYLGNLNYVYNDKIRKQDIDKQIPFITNERFPTDFYDGIDFPYSRNNIKSILKKLRIKENLSLRNIFIRVENFEYTIEKDDMYDGYNKVIFKFNLPSGSYATNFVKYLFLK
ncbi:MAG: tRNA pseudouridine(13) synthase TruD [Candidatus Nanoarchaeia archaeon]|nr:tRNA pseudouridine(13) synthase TruD [Candidatus Nanoarchaeia archaeon]